MAGKNKYGRNRLSKLIVVAFGVLVLAPFLILVFTSFKNMEEVFAHPVGLPLHWNFANYAYVLQNSNMLLFFRNSVVVTVTSGIIIIILATLASYGIVRVSGWIGTLVFGVFSFGMTIPIQANMVPVYLIMVKLNLLDSLLGLIIVYITFALPFSIFVISGFMRTIPVPLLEAAKIDGASEMHVLRKIFVPLSIPSLVTVFILNFVTVWNDLTWPLLFVRSDQAKTLPIALLRFQGEFTTNYPVLFSGVIMAVLPMLILYLFLQKYFVEGLTAGAVKG